MNLRQKKQEAIKILKNKAGNVSMTCEALTINRSTFYEWKNKDKKFRKAVEDVEESLIDYVESRLMKNIDEGKETSAIFFLKTKGKSRGYIERTEIEHDGGIQLPATINVKVHK